MKKNKIVNICLCFLSIMISVLVCLPAQAQAITGKKNYNGPACVAGFCFDDDLLDEADLVANYGTGYVIKGLPVFHCYHDIVQKVFVTFKIYHGEPKSVVSFFVSDRPSCIDSTSSKKPFKKLSTKEGLKIGDSINDVIKIYGKPDTTDKDTNLRIIAPTSKRKSELYNFGDTALNYFSTHDQLLRATIYVRDGKVSAILVTTSP